MTKPGIFVHRELEGDPRATNPDSAVAGELAAELLDKLHMRFPYHHYCVLKEAANEPFRRIAVRRRWNARRSNKPVAKRQPYGRTIGEPGAHYHLTKGWSGDRQGRRV